MIRDWLRNVRKYLIYTTAGLLAVAGSSRAQAPDDVNARLAAQERQIQELKAMIQANGIHPAAAADAKLDDASVKKIVDGYMAEKEGQRKAADAEAALKLETEGFKVGSDLSLKARWDYFGGFVAETPNKDFTFHIGARFQEDTVAWTQSPGSKSAAQLGDFQDGTFFRRIRINMNGTMWQTFEYNTEFALEQVKEGIPTLDEVWAGTKDIPFLGTIRAGHMHIFPGLEGDGYSSSKAMTFMEKSYITDALFQNENQAPAVLVTNSVLDQHMTWATMFYRQEFEKHNNDGVDLGDGKYAYGARVTMLPIWQNEGTHFLHLGASASWRKAENADPGLVGPGGVTLFARPLMRDAIGDYGGVTNGGAILPGDTKHLVDTGLLNASSTAILAGELFYVCGPFSIQSESAYTQVSDASIAGVPVVGANASSTRSFWGTYVQASYFLTGEHRTYDRRMGRLDPNYFTGPNTNFWFTRDADGHMMMGRGAWEIAARYNYLNLNDGPIHGGVVNGTEVALNWYLNPAVKIQFEYETSNRWDLKAGQLPSTVQSFGTRLQLSF